jgi:SAM-dependent methyltransferase
VAATGTPRRGRLRRDLGDAWRSLRGHATPRVPIEERSWIRRRAAELYYSDRGRRLRGDLLDLRDRLGGERDPLVPPRRLQSVGEGDFVATGAEFRVHLIELGGLRPQDDVLDVGSGIGRMAYPLRDYVQGRYEGFDIVAEAVEWCRREFTPRHPNFHFQLADIHNRHYNPGGRFEPHEYRFPYEDDSFDFALLTSVFTHLLPAAVERYLAELRRVLRPGGTCFATYFLINEESRRLMRGKTGAYFRYDHGDYLTIDEQTPEIAVAFEEDWVRDAHERAALPIERVHHGGWSGREKHTSFQDITISRAGGG